MTTYKNWTRIKWDGNPDLGRECWRKTFGKGHVSVGIGEFHNVVFSFGAHSGQSHSGTRWNYDQPPLSEVQVMLQLDMMWELKGHTNHWRLTLPSSIYQRDLSRPYILGDYVLATKYENGRASDPWVLGFYAGGTPGGRWFKIVDDNLQPLNQEGFQRMERVHPEVGATLLKEVAALRATPGLDIWKMTAGLEKQRQAISKLNQEMKVSPPVHEESEPAAPTEPAVIFEPIPLAEIIRMATTHEGFRLEVSQGMILALGCILPWTEIKVGQMWVSVAGPPVRVTSVTEHEVRYEWFTPKDAEEPKAWDKDPFSFQARYSLVLAEAGDTSFSVCVTRSSEQVSTCSKV